MRDENWIQRWIFLTLACSTKIHQEIGKFTLRSLSLRIEQRSTGNGVSPSWSAAVRKRDQPAQCARSKPENGATTPDTGKTVGDISWCSASYVRTRYKFTLCFYYDCYYFLIKRYCAVPRPCSREQMMWNDELTRPCASYCSTFAPALVSTCHYRNDPFVLLVDTWSISYAVHDCASAGSNVVPLEHNAKESSPSAILPRYSRARYRKKT